MRILFLNDLGFQYGAGIGHARQIQSLLLGGHVVGAVCGEDGRLPESMLFTRNGLADGWRGMKTMSALFRSSSHTEQELIDGVLAAVASFYPDLVVVGNLHSAGWPVTLLRELTRLRCRVIAYVHDLYLATGRCVYPGSCTSYLTGCGSSCPTATEYPPLSPELIAGAWRVRREVLEGGSNVILATNSEYMRRTASAALPGADVRTVYLGADEKLFRPGNQRAARKALGLPLDKPIVLVGAVNLADRRKGAHLLKEIVRRVGSRAQFAAFGYPSEDLPTIHATGYQSDPRRMALVYQAADVFLGTASEEAFGQTILEAGLSGLPVAAFAVGGVPEIVTPERTGLLVPAGNVRALTKAVTRLIDDEVARRRLGTAARAQCVARFSLAAQLKQWAPLLERPHASERRVA